MAGAVAAGGAWQAHETASAQAIQGAGYTIAQQVRVTWAGAAGAYSMMDTVGTKNVGNGVNIVMQEAKDGLFSKLSPAQMALFRAGFKSGDLIIENAAVAKRLSLEAGVSLARQGNLYVAVDALVAGRSTGQFARLAARAGQGGFLSIGAILSSPRAIGRFGIGAVLAEFLTHHGGLGNCTDGVCADTPKPTK